MPDALRLERVTYRYPGGAAPALDDVDLDARARASWSLLAGASGSGKSTLLRAACGLVPHFYGGELAGRVRGRRAATRASTGPAELADVAAIGLPGPRVAGRDERRSRAELELPLESRGARGAAAARAVEETALALGIGDCSSARCTRSPAASCSASRSRRRS